MFSISFICRSSKVNKMGLAPVECSIIYGKKRTFIQLPRREKPEDFKRLMAGRSNDLKSFCLAYHSKVQAAFSELFVRGVEITPVIIKQYIRGEFAVVYTVSMLCSEYLELLKKRVDCDDLSLQVYFKYERIYKRLIGKVGGDLPVVELTNGLLVSFLTELKKDYDAATVCGYWQKVKTLVRYAQDNGRLKVNPCSGIKVSRGQKRVTIFTVEEYERIRDKVISIERLSRVRDLFVLACNCGLAFCDIVSLKREDIKEVDGKFVIEKKRKKTGIVFSAVVLNDGVNILRKYNFDLSRLIYISNQKVNCYLRELGDICHVVSVPSIHYHLCRHFYITRLLREGVSPSIVKLCAGHSSIKLTTSTYMHLTSHDVVKGITAARAFN